MTSIRLRLGAALCGLACLVVAMLALSFWVTRTAERDMKEILAERVMPLRDLKAISDAYAVDIVDTSHKVRGGSYTPRKGIESVEASVKIIEERWAAFLKSHLSEEEKPLVAEAQKQKSATDAGVRRLLGIMRTPDHAVAIAAFNDGELYPIIEPMTSAIDKLVNLQIAEAERDTAQAAGSAAVMIRLMWALLGLSICSIALALLVCFKGVLQPLARLTRSVSAIGAGSLDRPVPDQRRRDEIGSMAKVIEKLRIGSRELRDVESERAAAAAREIARRDALLGSIRTLADDVAANVAVVNRSVAAIQDTSAVLGDSAGDTARRSASAESSLNGNTEAIQAMAAATSELSSAIEEVSGQGGRIVDAVNAMAARTEAAGARFDELNATAAKAQSAVDLIASVADQTNLLALNATIEAARAGEAGRGFAVVASEVKALAGQAARATSDIRELIESMNGTSTVLREAMAEVLDGVGDLRSVAVFVKEAVEEQSLSTASISRSIEETAQTSSHILSDVQVMNRSAQETGEAAGSVEAVAEDLIAASARLEADMTAFAERMQAA
jgi:methyl-accepting chemotaxis protein